MCRGSARLFWLIALTVTPLVARAGERDPAPVFSGGFISNDLGFDLSTPTWCCDGLPSDPLPQPAHELRALPPDPSSTLFMLYALGSLAAVEVSAGLRKLGAACAQLARARSGGHADPLEAAVFAPLTPAPLRVTPAPAAAPGTGPRTGWWTPPRVRPSAEHAHRLDAPRPPPES